MHGLTILNSKQRKAFLKKVEEQWGATFSDEYVFLQKARGKVYIVNRDITEVDLGGLRINNVGIYIAEERDGAFRLSIEGTQMLGDAAAKNVIEISRKDANSWMLGEDLNREEDVSGFVIVKCGEDYLGCGKYSKGVVYNYVGKNRRINAVH